jgi:hypothetical protein
MGGFLACNLQQDGLAFFVASIVSRPAAPACDSVYERRLLGVDFS